MDTAIRPTFPVQSRLWWMPGGLCLVGLHFIMNWLSRRYGEGSEPAAHWTVFFVALLVLAGVVYLVSLRGLRRAHRTRGLTAWIILIGAASRAFTLNSTPVLETDYYRYLWDGGVAAHGVNPYAYAPEEARRDGGQHDGDPGLGRLRQLGVDSTQARRVLERVNHPDLRTIYPPVAQAAFAAAHWLEPWSLGAWRLTLFAFDGIALAVLALLLRVLKLPSWALAIYWWNPLLIKECYNSAHMDLLLVPFVLGSLLCAVRKRISGSVLLLALATGVKLWPVVLLPLILRQELHRPRRFLPALALFVLLGGVLFLPVAATQLDLKSGFVAYGRLWEMNDALFRAIRCGTQSLLSILSLDGADAGVAARGLAVSILAGVILWFCRRPASDGLEVCRRCLWTSGALFLLSPAQFPWYFVWVLPFLALQPRFPLLLLTVLLPLYYLRYYVGPKAGVDFLDDRIVWLEFAPVWALLARDGWITWTQRRGDFPRVTRP